MRRIPALPRVLLTGILLVPLVAARAGAQEPAAPASGAPVSAATAGTWTFRTEVRDLEEPADVAIDAEGRIFAVETGAHRISIFDADGTRVGGVGRGRGSGSGELLEPHGLALDAGGQLFVADTGNHRVQVFSPRGEPLAAWGGRGSGDGRLDRPRGIAVEGERVYVADSRNARVQVFDLEGRHQLSLGSRGAGPGQFDEPIDVVADDEGNVYVIDAGASRIQKFDARGAFLKSWGDWGAFTGLLDGARGLFLHADQLFVAERNNHRIQFFSTDGRVLGQWGVHALRPREGGGKFHYPNAVAIDGAARTAVVCEGFEDRLQVFALGEDPPEEPQIDPNLVRTGGSPHYGERLDTAGDLLVLTEPITHRVLVFDLADGEPVLIHTLGGYGRKFGQLIRPADVVLDAEVWRLWVVDRGNRRLQLFRLSHRPEDRLRFVPDMSRLVRSVELDAVLPQEATGGVPCDPVALEEDAEGRLYLVDARSARVLVLTDELELERSFGGYGEGPGQMREPTDLAWSPSGELLYVVDSENARVHAFAPDGELRFTMGGAAGGAAPGNGPKTRSPGTLLAPFGVAVGRDGSVWVSDARAHRLAAFTPGGVLSRNLGREGLGASEFFKPRGLVEDATGRLIAIDYGNHRGQIFDAEREFVRAFGARLFVKETRRSRARPAVRRE